MHNHTGLPPMVRNVNITTYPVIAILSMLGLRRIPTSQFNVLPRMMTHHPPSLRDMTE